MPAPTRLLILKRRVLKKQASHSQIRFFGFLWIFYFGGIFSDFGNFLGECTRIFWSEQPLVYPTGAIQFSHFTVKWLKIFIVTLEPIEREKQYEQFVYFQFSIAFKLGQKSLFTAPDAFSKRFDMDTIWYSTGDFFKKYFTPFFVFVAIVPSLPYCRNPILLFITFCISFSLVIKGPH